MADDVYKGLGIKRRKGQADEAAPDDAPAKEGDAPASDIRKGLGIKRRSGGGSSGRAPAADDAPAAKESTGAAKGDEAELGGPEAAAEAAAKGRGLGSDVTAQILANHFKFRTELRDRLPERLWELNRTHGRYFGDGREVRKLEVGFKPALVLYVIPPYGIDKPVKFTTKGFTEPGLHRQPEFEEQGFVVDTPFNQLGDMYMYVAFEDDGQPLESPDEKKGRRGRRSDSGRASSDAIGASLGIKRRKKAD